MARQIGPVRYDGALGDITYFKNKEGYQARHKGGPSAEAIATDPKFQRLREQMAEFKTVAIAGKRLRKSIRLTTAIAKDGSMCNRLTRELFQVIKSDTTSQSGFRKVENGNLALIQGFEFNKNAAMPNILLTNYTPSFNRATGAASVVFETFVPKTHLVSPLGATHFRLVMGSAEIDFLTGEIKDRLEYSTILPIDMTDVPQTTLTATLPVASELNVIVSVGIELFKQINGIDYPLFNRTYNACTLALVSTPV